MILTPGTPRFVDRLWRPLRFRAPRRHITIAIVLACILVQVLIPVCVSLAWYPPYPDSTVAATLIYVSPHDTVLIESTPTWLIRVSRHLRANTPADVDTCKLHLSPVRDTKVVTRSAIPPELHLNANTPYGLVVEYGWPTTVARSFVTGTLMDCALRTGTLHNAIRVIDSKRYFITYYGIWPFRAQKGAYLADVPFGAIPILYSVYGLIVGTLVVSGMAWLAAGIAMSAHSTVRAFRGRCTVCGYDIRMLGSQTACPECGTCVRESVAAN